MAKKATTLHDNLGNELLPVTNASITYMDDGNTVQAEIQDLKEKTQYNKGHYTTEQDLLNAYPNNIENPQVRKGWYAIIGETDSVWIWDIEGNEWKDSGVSSGGVESVNGLDGEVVLTGSNINATATINDTSKTELINKHLTDIYSELDNKVDLDSSQLITGTKVFTETIGLANTSEGTVDQIKHINSNFLITSGTGQNLLNIDEGLGKISAFNRELAYEDEIAEIQGNYVTNDILTQELQTVTDMIPTKVSELTNDSNYATEQYVQQNGGKIDTISVNGAPQTITNKNVNISVPTNNSQLINSENYQNKSEVETLINNSVKNCFQYGMTTSPNADGNGFTFLTTLKDKNGNEAGIYAVTAMEKPEQAGYSTNGVGLNLVTSNGNHSYLNIIDSPSNQGITLMSDGIIGKNTKSGDFYSISLPDNNGTLALVEDLDTKQDTLSTSQLQAVNSGATSTNIGQITTNSNNINTINSKIPNQASSTNQLADKDFVNSSLNSITAFYITSNANGDPFATKSALTTATTYYSGGQVTTPTRNDYAIVLSDETKDNATTRYIYYNQWEYQYTVNETSLTADQLSAINSGITSTLVGKISSNEQMLNSLSEQVATEYVPNTRTINNKPLSSNITLNASDVGALPSTTVIPDISGLATQSALNTTNTNVTNLTTRVTTNETNIAKKLDKVTYEYNKELAIGSTGKVLVGKFPMYDSNLTIEVSSTTNDTYNGTLVIATQNINDSHGGNYKANVYGDPTGTLSSAFVVKYPTNSRVFEVYCNFPSWSKNLIHIKAVALSSAPSNIVELVNTVPTDSLVTVNNVLTSTFTTQTDINNATANCLKYGYSTSPNADENGVNVATTLIDANGNPSAMLAVTSNPDSGSIIGLTSMNGESNSIVLANGVDEALQISSAGSFYKIGSNGDMVYAELPNKSGTLATQDDIPTNYVTTDTKQNVTASKVFTKGIGVGLQSDDYWTITGDISQLIIGKGKFSDSSAHTGYSPNITLKSTGELNVADSAGRQKTVAYTTDIPKLVTLTQAEYDALSTKDANTYYFIKEE